MNYGIGQPVMRKEDVRLVTGKGRYLDDVALPNEAHACFVRSPHAHAVINSVDAKEALAMAGVLGVVLAADTAGTGPMPIRGAFTSRDGSDVRPSPKLILPTDKARFVGEAVAMVVAETPALAKDAAERVIVDYCVLPAQMSLEASASGPDIWPDVPGNLSFDWAAGDEAACTEAFARAAKTVSVELVQNRVAPNPMEPRGAIGDYDSETDRYTLYTSTQGPSTIRDRIATALLRIAPERLRVISPDVGGGFGMKATAVAEQALVLIAAKKFGRPVKWVGERMEAFLADGHGRDVKMKGELALDADARILALRLTSAANLGAYMSHVAPFIPTINLRVMGGLYRVPATFAHVKGYFTNTTSVTAYRGAGRPEAIYITERLMDIAAAAFKLDPVEIRRRNLIRNEELPYKNWRGLMINSGDFLANLDTCVTRADWTGFAARRAETESRGKKRGRGVCSYFEASGGPPVPEPSAIHFKDDGTVELVVATQSNGQGHETAFAQILSEKLGVPYDAITLRQGDTDDGLSGGGTVGSRSLQAAGNAIGFAVEAVVKKGKAAAGQILQAGGAEVGFGVDAGVGLFRVAGTERTISVTELARVLKRETLPGFENGLDDGGIFNSPPTFPNGCHVCEVEVDPETGTIELVRYVIVDDVGRVVNPLIVDGQIHGGVAQGLGQALMENVVYDETGQLLTASFTDYAMPRAHDMPALDLSYNEVLCRTNPLGTKGAGEAGTIGALAVIVAAVSDAVGVTHIDMPLTPEKIWRALKK